MSEIDKAAFGKFIGEQRRQLGMTQKQLARLMMVSDKAVSKWETGISIPDVALLEPLAEILGVTLTELLHGEKMDTDSRRDSDDRASADEKSDHGKQEQDIPLEERLTALMKDADEVPEDREGLRELKKKRRILYLLGTVLAVGEVTAMYLLSGRLGISLFDISLDMLIPIPLLLFMGIWPFFTMPERLPELYDKMKISTYSHGFFQLSICGVYFNNRNWPYITKALRLSCLLIPVCWPAVYVPVRLLTPDFIWLFGRIAVLLILILGGLFIPLTVLAKKYE